MRRQVWRACLLTDAVGWLRSMSHKLMAVQCPLRLAHGGGWQRSLEMTQGHGSGSCQKPVHKQRPIAHLQASGCEHGRSPLRLRSLRPNTTAAVDLGRGWSPPRFWSLRPNANAAVDVGRGWSPLRLRSPRSNDNTCQKPVSSVQRAQCGICI